MALYTISDLHLPLGIDKPMDVFGTAWENYVHRLYENWQSVVCDDDLVVLPGDLSWATYLDQAKADFEFLNSLNGKKIILKGNHDYWWETYNKMSKYLLENNYSTVTILNNNAVMYGSCAICGNRGWSFSENMSDEDRKIYEREVGRLRLSMDDAIRLGAEDIIVFTHYPPINKGCMSTPMTQLMHEFGVSKCFYGHLHSDTHKFAVQGDADGIAYKLVSADYLGFMPYKICD